MPLFLESQCQAQTKEGEEKEEKEKEKKMFIILLFNSWIRHSLCCHFCLEFLSHLCPIPPNLLHTPPPYYTSFQRFSSKFIYFLKTFLAPLNLWEEWIDYCIPTHYSRALFSVPRNGWWVLTAQVQL